MDFKDFRKIVFFGFLGKKLYDHFIKEKRVKLYKEKPLILEADDPRYKRGLVVTLKDEGGYDMYYWYDDPAKIYPAEMKVDGQTITQKGSVAHIGFHPELAEPTINEQLGAIHTKKNYSIDPKIALLGFLALGSLTK
tara:strand:+ start:344 stop:754 length:411 start_codon:yes stop_codon:yes gene_type:complete